MVLRRPRMRQASRHERALYALQEAIYVSTIHYHPFTPALLALYDVSSKYSAFTLNWMNLFFDSRVILTPMRSKTMVHVVRRYLV